MYATSNPQKYNEFREVFLQWWTRRSHHRTGSTQKEQARSDGWADGLDLGFCIAAASHANQIRCEMYPHWKLLPLVIAEDVQREVVPHIIAEYEERIGSINAREHGRIKEATATWEQLTIEYIESTFALPDELVTGETERRRAAILRGEEQPLEEDRDWLEEKLEEGRRQFEELQRILGGTP